MCVCITEPEQSIKTDPSPNGTWKDGRVALGVTHSFPVCDWDLAAKLAISWKVIGKSFPFPPALFKVFYCIFFIFAEFQTCYLCLVCIYRYICSALGTIAALLLLHFFFAVAPFRYLCRSSAAAYLPLPTWQFHNVPPNASAASCSSLSVSRPSSVSLLLFLCLQQLRLQGGRPLVRKSSHKERASIQIDSRSADVGRKAMLRLSWSVLRSFFAARERSGKRMHIGRFGEKTPLRAEKNRKISLPGRSLSLPAFLWLSPN